MNLKLEVVVIPVSDVDRAKASYTRLGFREDVDFVGSHTFRVVHLTPPGSACSIVFGNGITSARPGSMDRLGSTPQEAAAAAGLYMEELLKSAPP